MVSLDDLRELILYKKDFFLPIENTDKRKGAAIVLLTPNYQSSISAMTKPYMVNRKYYESYYLEKSVTKYIKNESVYSVEDKGEYLFEEALSSKERKELEDNEFGLPSQRRYPLNDKAHVLAAIRLFNHVEKEYEEELARNIIKKIKEFDMGDKIKVGDNNRFKPYWEKSNLSKSINEADGRGEEHLTKSQIVERIKNAFREERLDLEIPYPGANGATNFINGKGNLVLGPFDKYEYEDAYYIIRDIIPKDEYTVSRRYMSNGECDITIRPIRDLDEAALTKKLVNGNAMIKNTSDKLSSGSIIYFNGYEADIKEVKKYFSKSSGKDEFKRLKLYPPKKIIVQVVSDPNVELDQIDELCQIYTPKAFKYKGYNFDYKDYIKYSLQLYAIYTMKPSIGIHNKMLEVLTSPLAILLSGIADKEIENSVPGDRFYFERVFKYIIDVYGIEKAKEIVQNNLLEQFRQYAKEYSGKALSESDLGLSEEEYNLLNEIGELPDVSIPQPESMYKIGNFATNLKRRIRKPIYKMNKIARDLVKGNLGKEERGQDQSTITQLQTGDITGNTTIEKDDGTPVDPAKNEGSLEDFKKWSNGNYVLEGNYMYLFEDNNYDIYLRRALYGDRFKNNKAVLDYYKRVKNDLPFIKFAYPDIARYNGRNVFVDLSYYNDAFFRNMEDLNDEDKSNTVKIFNIYSDLIERMLDISIGNNYKKRTIFIPVLDWRHNNSARMWMYKEDINPISLIYNYVKNRNSKALIKLFGKNDVVFLGDKNYFKINFSKTDLSNPSNLMKFMNLIKRIITLGYNSPADPDPADESEKDSPTGIAMDIIDKVEKSQNVLINNLSAFAKLNKKADIAKDPMELGSKIIDSTCRDDSIAVKNNITPEGIDSDIEIKTYPSKITVRDFDKSKNVEKAVAVISKDISKQDAVSATKSSDIDKAVNDTSEEDKKDAIVDAVANAANNSVSTDNALDYLNTEEFKAMISDLHNNSEDNARVDKARASKVMQTEDKFHEKEVAGKSVKDLLNEDPAKHELAKTDLKIASINKDWSEMHFMNFDKKYDPDSDIVKMLDSMQHWTFPIAVKNIEVTDNSTSEDIVNLWKIDCVDYKGTNFTLKVDIPRFINGSNFLKLRGNEKNLLIQSTMIPIVKTDVDACQIIGSGGYNKTFLYRVNNRRGQSMPSTSRLIRTLNTLIKNDSKEVKVISGDNSKICQKYELPIDYIDIASGIDSIKTKFVTLYFNQDEFRLNYKVDDTKGIPIGIKKVPSKDGKEYEEQIIYYSVTTKKTFNTIASFIVNILFESKEFRDIYETITVTGNRFSYTQASILSVRMPLIVMCGYLEGLTTTLSKAGIEYNFVQKIDSSIRRSDEYDYIRFSDGFLVYKVNYSSSLLLNGLKEHDTESYSVRDVNNRQMYLDFLENYGGLLKADGLENAYDCMIDPITKEILEMYKLPTDYIGVMLHGNSLMADNKYIRHTDQTGRRWRRKELLAGYFYKVLTTAYQEYANSIRHNRKGTKMSMKQSAVIDYILSGDPATTNLSVSNAINDVECANDVTNKGLVGMNSARAYSVGTRTYDESMLNVLGMDTAFSGSVGINRQATVDANISSGRGIVKSIDGDADKLSIAKTMTITEAMTPLGSTHDDPQRTLMTFAQTSKHMIRCENNDPSLITTGADEALPYLTSDIFAFKAKQDGTVIELVQEGQGKSNYMVVQYKDGSYEYVNLSEEIKHNSDGGYFVPMKLDTDLQVGSKVKEGNVLAYDKLSFSKSLGESGNLAANLGTLAKVAIINTDEGFEDSAAITESFAKRLGSEVIMSVESIVDKGSNLFVYKNIGDHVMEGDSLFAYQADFDDDVANVLLKNLTIDDDRLSELGRKPVKTSYTGTVAGIQIFRTVELDEMSDSLRKFCEKYESSVNKIKKVYNKYGIDTATLPPTTKLPNTGKAKNVDNGVKIIYYIKHLNGMSVGDKIVFYSANKGIIKYIIPEDNEPYTDFRKDEHIDSFMSLSSISGRMTCSIPLFAATSKLMVELDRSIKDLAGIPHDNSKL